jgi:hypothetical protein
VNVKVLYVRVFRGFMHARFPCSQLELTCVNAVHIMFYMCVCLGVICMRDFHAVNLSLQSVCACMYAHVLFLAFTFFFCACSVCIYLYM